MNIYQLSDPSKFAKLVELQKHYRRQLSTMLARPFLADLKKWIEDCTPLLSSRKYKMSTKVHWILNGLLFFPFLLALPFICWLCGQERRKC